MVPRANEDQDGSARHAPSTVERTWIEFAGVSKSFTQEGMISPLFAELNLTIERGEIVCILGKNGVGKTTLLKLLAGFLQPDSGAVLVGRSKVARPGRARAFVCQEDTLFPWLTLRGNIEFGLSDVDQAVRSTMVEDVTAMMELGEKLDRRPHELSGGFRKRASIARALALEPEVLILDESFSPLDPDVRERVYDQILSWWTLREATIVLATHSIPEAVRLGTRVLLLADRPARVCVDFHPSGSPIGTSRRETFRADIDCFAEMCSEGELTS